MTLFNVAFTSATPLLVGMFDRPLGKRAMLRYPQLYRQVGCGWPGGRVGVGLRMHDVVHAQPHTPASVHTAGMKKLWRRMPRSA